MISAVSQGVKADVGQDLELTRWDTIVADEATQATNIDGVYAGGDCVRGPTNVISAIADGKRAAAAIDKRLSRGKPFLMFDGPKTMADKENVLRRNGTRPREWRPTMDMLAPDKRNKTFKEFTRTLTQAEAVKEASRCLTCGCGAGCEICKDICKVFAWDMDPQGRVVLDEDKCLACGMCILRCPNQNIKMVQTSEKPV